MRFSTISFGALLLASAAPAMAQDAAGPGQTPEAKPAETPAYTVTGGVTGITDYRFRGTTQTDEKPAVQATLNLNSAVGFYVGTWASTIDGGRDGSTPALTGYGNVEWDLYAGYTKTLSNGLGIDVGLLYYFYPGGQPGQKTDFFEPYGSLSYTVGPVGLKAGYAYAWGKQDGLKGFDIRGGNDDNLYLYSEASVGIPNTPVTLKTHGGYSKGALGSLNGVLHGGNDDDYFDWSLTAEAVFATHFKVGVSYVDTDISDYRNFASNLGRDATVLGYVGLSF